HHDANEAATAVEWVTATMDRHGRLDGLTNNAGVAHIEALEDLTDELLDDMWTVNVKAPLKLIQHALPHLRASGEARMVNVVSMSGKRVSGTFGPGYAMSKHAALALHHAVRHATHPDGIRTTAVCPGFVATDMTTEFGPEKAMMIQPEDLAETVATIVRLPNTANVAELLMTCEPEVIA
ncbi:MAG: SDR family NAD(P)-dependent oxidoreductase, partial [Actinomycetota bacterium]|nr:SDR family NAD(P)-dependent oxidoreductase [Actinomycetota bacterium]